MRRKNPCSARIKKGRLYSPFFTSRVLAWNSEFNEATPTSRERETQHSPMDLQDDEDIITKKYFDGFHIWKRSVPTDMRAVSYFDISKALVTVAMYGRAFDHGNGYRVATAIIQRIFLHPDASKSLIASVKKNYPLAEVGTLQKEKKTIWGYREEFYCIPE